MVTWNVTSPYEYLSVSKPLTYSGTNQADPIFTVSMSCSSNRFLSGWFSFETDSFYRPSFRGPPDEEERVGPQSRFLGRCTHYEFWSCAFNWLPFPHILPFLNFPAHAVRLRQRLHRVSSLLVLLFRTSLKLMRVHPPSSILARDLLTDHTMCAGVPGYELWP